MPFEVVSGIGSGMGVVEGGPRALREGGFQGFSFPLVSVAYF